MESYQNKIINVLHVVETLDIGGAECVVADIVNNSTCNIKSSICCLKHSGEVEKRLNPNVEIFSLYKKEGNSLCIIFRLSKIMIERKIDVVHTHNWGVFCESVFAALLARVPIRIHMAHGGLLTHQNTVGGLVKKKIRRLLEFIATLFCDKIISVSDDLKKIIATEIGVNLSKIITLRNSIKIYSIDNLVRESTYKQLGRNSKEFIICFVGRLVVVKNLPFLLSALKNICILHPNVKLLIVGDGSEKDLLVDMVNSYKLDNNVFFLGSRNDVRNILSICNLFVLPSLSEGISISLLEAMSMKVPVIATNVGGNAEVINNEETGILIEPNDIVELEFAILRIINNPEASRILGENAYFRVISHFNIDKNIKKILSMYFK